jgi:hypothetical protein
VNFWLGLGLDFFADPLLGGAYLRGLSRVARVPGLLKVADAMDTASEALMLVGGLPSARVVRAARTLPGFRQVESAMVNSFVGNYVQKVVEWADRTTSPLKPMSGQEFSISGMFFVDRGRLPGAADDLRQIGAAAAEVSENSGVLLMQAMAAAGDSRWKQYLNRMQQSMSIVYDLPVDRINSFTPVTSRAIMTQAYSTAEDIGYVALREMGMPGVRSASVSPSPSDIVARAGRDMDRITDIMRAAPLDQAAATEFRVRRTAYQQAIERVRSIARDAGDNVDDAEQAFNTVLEKFQQASAVEGYFASGFPMLNDIFKENFVGRLSALTSANPQVGRAIQAAGGDSRVVSRAWRELLEAGANGRAADILSQPIRFPGSDLLPDIQQVTYRQMFGEFADLPNLNVGTWLDSLSRGHMRRVFGVFQDEDSWRLAVRGLEDGRVVPVRTVNENDLLNNLRQAFPQETRIMEQFIKAGSPVRAGKATGGFVHQADAVRHMHAQGIPADRIQSFWDNLAAAADPYINGPGGLAERLRRYGAENIGDAVRPGVNPVFSGSRASLGTRRQDLGEEELTTLMELMDPIVSRVQSAVVANRATRRSSSLAAIYKHAKDQGLVIPAGDPRARDLPSWWKAVRTEDADMFPMLAGNYVHPTVLREFRNVAALGGGPRAIQNGIANVRSLISAGYLANPATTTANIAGGFWTALEYGINPVKLARNMRDVYVDWKRMGRDLPDLAHMRDILDNGAAHTDLVRFGGDIGAEFFGVRDAVQGFSNALGEAGRKYNEWLRRPLGTRSSGALGLGVFEASETLFRLGTFRMVMKETAGDIAEARRMARFVVFDYAAQPGAVQIARDTGVFLFPAFPYFMFGRTLNAAVNRPGVLAAGERAAELIWNMTVPDEDTRIAMLGGMDDWMRDDKFVPVRRKEDGDYSMLSLNQLLPTNTLTGAPFRDSLTSLGLMGPLIDMALALIGAGDDRGSQPFTGQYGRRVLPTGTTSLMDDPMQTAKGLGAFLWNTFAPGNVRKMVRMPEDFDQRVEGVVPGILRSLAPTPPEWMESGRTVRELATRRADQDAIDALLSFSIRSTRTVATEGRLANIMTILGRAADQRDKELADIDRRLGLLEAEGRQDAIAAQMRKREVIIERFYERWGDLIEEFVRMRDAGRFEAPRR